MSVETLTFWSNPWVNEPGLGAGVGVRSRTSPSDPSYVTEQGVKPPKMCLEKVLCDQSLLYKAGKIHSKIYVSFDDFVNSGPLILC